MSAETGVTLSEAEREVLVASIVLDMDNPDRDWGEVPKVFAAVEAIVASRVAEAETQVGADWMSASPEQWKKRVMDSLDLAADAQSRAEKAEAALSEAEQRGAREALLAAADDAETALFDEMVPETVKQTDFIAWLRRRSLKIGSEVRDV
jgi:hypothetical protein